MTARTVVLWALIALLSFPSSLFAAPAKEGSGASRERAAAAAFRAGELGKALELYTALYEETQQPVFLRNIARCHQMRRDAEPALAAFRQYIDVKRDMTANERREIELYMSEMEDLQRLLSKPPVPAVALTPPTQAPAPEPVLVRPALAVVPASPPPFYRRWWFWGAVGAVVAGGVVTALVVRREGRIPCRGDIQCPK